MTLLAPGFEAADLTPVGDWHPARYTDTLTGDEHFTTDADRFLPVVAKVWQTAEAKIFAADPWQLWLLRRILETYPPDWPVVELRGQLRYRQVVVSMGRQNGKSVLGALLAFYLLTMHVRGPRVGGFASRDRQARVVYDRVKYVADNSPLVKLELKATATRGITRRHQAGIYQTLPASEDSVQGEPFSGAIYDELHIGLAALWDAIVLGQRSFANALLVGITTAGDDDSALLIRLYSEAETAIAGNDERFGAFIWEALSDDLTEAGIIAANPAVACGRISLDVALSEARKMWAAPPDETGVPGRSRVIRYTLNRFVQGSSSAWSSLPAWNTTATPAQLEHGPDLVYGIDRTNDQAWTSIHATSRTGEHITTHLVASIPDADVPHLVTICRRLAGAQRVRFALDRSQLGDLANALIEDGYEVFNLGAAEMQAAASAAHAKITRRHVIHPGDPLTKLHMGRGKRRTTPEGWRISRTLSGDVDAVLSMVVSTYAAILIPDNTQQLY